ncbi:helveticin [Lactobacillus sp. PV037]|uniref:phage holin, LLH family n=1 Tax=unclassified Lactobacillus TaxID=2620435 RepID=UPI00223FDE92|nr:MULTISPECIES: phage holin, LLH family [unclassified Lactobacillus]QNQ81652.1 helveticin [Lactobacillus sp. PV012]QNQ84301.1 helveticin [Lactobacillus sp. PV037]
MRINDYIDLVSVILWILSLFGVAILSRLHFKHKKLEKIRLVTTNLLTSYLYLYDTNVLNNQQQLNEAAKEVADYLQNKGIKITDEEVKKIFLEIEESVTDLKKD